MFDRLRLAEDLTDCRGSVLGARGLVVSPQTIAEAAQRAPALPRRPLGETALADDLPAPLAEPAYAALFGRPGAREGVARVLAAAALPEVLHEELAGIRRDAPALYRHALVTASVAVRVLLVAVGRARELPDLAAAGLLHELGMRHLPAGLAEKRDRLDVHEAHRIAAHPLLGAYHLACVLGDHPAVAAARSHHWRCGQGYPAMAGPPPRAVEVISVASAFAAMTQPRAYRSAPYDVRGAADVLAAEASVGHADRISVKLLVHALRGGEGDPRRLRFGAIREGHAPEVNRHTMVAAPSRSAV